MEFTAVFRKVSEAYIFLVEELAGVNTQAGFWPQYMTRFPLAVPNYSERAAL